MARKPGRKFKLSTRRGMQRSLSRLVVRARNQIRQTARGPGRQSLVNDFRDRPFTKAALVLGPPRGGTTIVSRCIGQHSGVQSVIEPFQRRRRDNYRETDPATLSADFGLHPDPGGCLLVKETFTRHENVDAGLRLLGELAAAGASPALIYVCRSPIAGFNSQVQASQQQWARQNTFSPSVGSLKRYLQSIVRNSLCTLFEPLSYQRVVVFYENFCADPEAALRRVMRTLDMQYQPQQLALDAPSPVRGGDPGARLKKHVEAIDDQQAVAMLPKGLIHSSVGVSALALHDVVRRLAVQDAPQEEAIPELRRVMQDISEQHFPNLYPRFLESA